MTIRVLPPEITEKIAAGEVVERPASVVKELMENALDAGASRVSVGIGAAVVDLLEVTDDGSGMQPEEVALALQRHATSKIVGADDLFRIATLGFRGEALASIAAVSELEVETRTREAPFGVRVTASGGRVSAPQEVGMPPGTRMRVRNLFQTTPARLKFLRSRQTESGNVLDIFLRMALSRVGVSFELRRGGRPWIQAPAVEDLRSRVGALLGRELAEGLRPVEGAEGSVGLRGLVGPPDVHRVSSRGVFLYVNERPVRDPRLQRALREAFGGALPSGRFPSAVLLLQVPVEEVDVNVHPTKMEVHFAEPRRIHDLIVQSVQRSVRPSFWVSERQGSRSAPPAGRLPERARGSVEEAGPRGDDTVRAVPGPRLGTDGGGRPDRGPTLTDAGGVEPDPRPRGPVQEGACAGGEPRMFSRMRVLGQYRESYIVCEHEDRLVLIDQHAAHERIAYDRLLSRDLEGRTASQMLLVPQLVELPPREAASLEPRLQELAACGMEVEIYGGRTFAVKSVPAILAHADPKRLLEDLAEEMAELEGSRRLAELRSHILARMACHSVVRAGRALRDQEIEALLEALDRGEEMLTCPHGRPVLVSWSLSDIEKRFQRQ